VKNRRPDELFFGTMAYENMGTKYTGFTLIELLVNIVIIAILSTISVQVYQGFQDRARRAKAQAELTSIRNGVLLLQLDTGFKVGGLALEPCSQNPEFNITDDQTGLLNNNAGIFNSNDWKGPYVDSDGMDPWGNPYVIDNDYFCESDIQGCEVICDRQDCENNIVVVAAVTTAGPDGIFNNYDAGEAIVTVCE